MNNINTVGNEINMIDEKINQLKSSVVLTPSELKQIPELEMKKRDLSFRLIYDQLKELELMEENRIRYLEKELSFIFGGEVVITRNDYICEIFNTRTKFYDVNLADNTITGFTQLGIKLDVSAIESLVFGIKTGMNFKLIQLASENKLPMEEITNDTPF